MIETQTSPQIPEAQKTILKISRVRQFFHDVQEGSHELSVHVHPLKTTQVIATGIALGLSFGAVAAGCGEFFSATFTDSTLHLGISPIGEIMGVLLFASQSMYLVSDVGARKRIIGGDDYKIWVKPVTNMPLKDLRY